MDIGRIEGFILVESPDSPEVVSYSGKKKSKRGQSRAQTKKKKHNTTRKLKLHCSDWHLQAYD